MHVDFVGVHSRSPRPNHEFGRAARRLDVLTTRVIAVERIIIAVEGTGTTPGGTWTPSE